MISYGGVSLSAFSIFLFSFLITINTTAPPYLACTRWI